MKNSIIHTQVHDIFFFNHVHKVWFNEVKYNCITENSKTVQSEMEKAENKQNRNTIYYYQ